MRLLDFFRKKETTEPTPELLKEPIIESPIETIDEVVQNYHSIEESKMDVNNDGVIDNKDLAKVEKYLSDPSLPDYKRGYYQALKDQIIKNL
jgi:hypothetical protein|tara:strand:+ start:566 stop:841 length:276 start_codon:yes stop_codon:yes gene_type:complete